jgi:hypothetical protein
MSQRHAVHKTDAWVNQRTEVSDNCAKDETASNKEKSNRPFQCFPMLRRQFSHCN